mgnify:CR=1 FL=1|jgi:hypothetical protein
MKKVSFFHDLLTLIGVLPINKPTPIKQEWKRMGYPVGYLRHISIEKRAQMEKETKKLFELIG